MSISFIRSERFLESDNSRSSTWGLLLVALLLVQWGGWFLFARVGVYAVSDTANLQVDQAAHPVESPSSPDA